MKTIKLTLFALLLCPVFTSCSLVPCSHVFPVLRWYWSDEAKRCREEHQQEEQWRKDHPIQSSLRATVSLGSADRVRPDPVKTPGAVFPDVTVEQLAQKGYANVLNGGVRNVPQSEKRAVFVSYFGSVPPTGHAGNTGTRHSGDYEIDHLISLELGGCNDVKNLWPESYVTQPWNSHVKDKLEDWMAASVRHALIQQGHDPATALLKQYQHEIATDWIAAYQKYNPQIKIK